MPLSQRSAVLLLLCSASLAGCGYGHDRGDRYSVDDDQACGSTIEEATIDTDQLLEAKAGEGAGVFVEYEAGGAYHVSTACDSYNGIPCYWDIVVRSLDGAKISSVSPGDLERNDNLTFGADDELGLVAVTGEDYDGFSLQTAPGAALSVDVLLDGGCGNQYLFWVGDGAVYGGAPSNPVYLVPSSP